MSDNEHTAASLGQSEVLSVQRSVGPPIPELLQRPEEGSKVPSSVRRQDAGDVLPDQPAGPKLISNCKIDERQVATRVSHSASESGDAEGLTGGSSDEKIDICNSPVVMTLHVSEVRNIGVVVREQRRRKRVNLRERDRLPSERMPSYRRCFDTAAH